MYPNYISLKLKGKAQFIKKSLRQSIQEAQYILAALIVTNSTLTLIINKLKTVSSKLKRITTRLAKLSNRKSST